MFCQCPNQPGLHVRAPTCPQPSQQLPERSSSEPVVSAAESSSQAVATTSAAAMTPEQISAMQRQIQAIFAANGQPMDATNITNIFPNMATLDEKRKRRVKVYANGFLMTFDKVSSCNERLFWRCEYKNTCNARIHTDMQRRFICNSIHDHNHPGVGDAELRLFGLDPANLENDRVYIIDTAMDHNERRRIRKSEALEEERRQRMAQGMGDHERGQGTSGSGGEPQGPVRTPSRGRTAHPIASTTSAFRSVGGHSVNRNRLPPTPSSQNPQPQPRPFPIPIIGSLPNSSESSDPSDLPAHPDYQRTVAMVKRLSTIWKREPSRVPRCCEAPTSHWQFFIANDDGAEEHIFMPMRIENREEAGLRSVLEAFCGRQLGGGRLVFEVAPKIKVIVNGQLLSNWENEQFFLIDASNPSQWMLKFVDDRVA